MSRIVVLVSGRGSNLQALIDAQHSQKIQSQIVAVISNKPEALALTRAQKAGMPTLVIASQGKDNAVFFAELLQAVKRQNPTWVVLAGFMKILPPAFVQAFAGKIINIHPSLLPLFPGLNAQAQALQAGVRETGCTVHFVDEGCDTGPVLLQKKIAISPDDTVATLSERLLVKEHECLVEAVRILERKLCASP